MAFVVRRSLLRELVVSAALLLCVWAPSAFAQRPIEPAGHPAGGGHVYAPPVYHAPVVRAPMVQAPVFRPPIFAPPISAGPSPGVLGTAGFPRPVHPIRPFSPVFVIYGYPYVFGGSFWSFNSCCLWATCGDFFWPFAIDYASVSSPGPVNYFPQVNQSSVYAYGEERPDLPELFLKDGAVLNVNDYWVVNQQLHFTMIEQYGEKPSEHVIPFDALDFEKTKDANTWRGFRFILRDEPLEQYMRDHPDGPPPER